MSKSRASIAARLLTVFCAACLYGPRAVAFDLETLEGLIQSKHLTTIEGVLAALPDDMLANYTLVHSSRSLQGADMANPRVLLFGNDARLIITFNGDPAQKRYNELELLQWRDTENRFELRAIVFGGKKPEISARNPRVCLTCHGQDPRPVWGSYDYDTEKTRVHWPGFYGSTHDAPRLVEAERQGYLSLRQRAADHPRYRFLKMSHPRSEWYPYGLGAYQHLFRPNDRLGNLLARLNARRVASRIVRSGFFEQNRYFVMTWLLGCPQRDSEAFAKSLAYRFAGAFPPEQYPVLHEELQKTPAEFRSAFMFEKLLSGLDVYNWNMNITTDAVSGRFSTGILTIDQLVAAAAFPVFVENEKWMQPYYRPWTSHEVYDTFRKGYFDTNVKPGGVGALYDRIALYYDESAARAACPVLWQRAQTGSTLHAGRP